MTIVAVARQRDRRCGPVVASPAARQHTKHTPRDTFHGFDGEALKMAHSALQN